MSVLAELRLPADEFVLAETLTAIPAIRIEIQRVVAGIENVTPYFWAFGDNLDDFERALRDDSSVREILMLEENQGDERFYRVTWHRQDPNLLSAVSDAKATILEAVNEKDGEWELRVLFPSRQALAEFHDYCITHGFSFRLKRVYQPENPQERGKYGVTKEQQEALEAAYHEGYFNVPRNITLTELADELDLSRNALSARLRRGHRNLLSNTIVHED